MARAVAQDALRRDLIEATEALLDRAMALEPLAGERMFRRPPDGGWSIGEVLEHLVISARLYFERMRPLIATAQPASATAAWRPTLMGRWLARSMTSTRRLPAPKGFRPGAAPRPAVLGAYLDDLWEVRGLLDRCAEVSWSAIRLSSPVSRLIRLNLGDCFILLVRHAERHGRQIDRLLGVQEPVAGA